MRYRVVIPARFASERLPGKPLADIHGKPMIVRVVESTVRSAAAEVVVATDEKRVADAVRMAGYDVELTRSDHPSGSDRVMEVVETRGWDDEEIVLNVQGDEPLIPPEVLNQLASLLTEDPDLASATLCEPIERYEDLMDPNIVKVVRDNQEKALYFSRAPIPYGRDSFIEGLEILPQPTSWWRHVGVYGYRAWSLRRFVALARGRLESLESLEQLRMLENGLDMRVQEACCPVPGGVDTQQDLDRIRVLLAP